MKILFLVAVFAVSVLAILLFDPLNRPFFGDFGIFLYSSGAYAGGIVAPRVSFDIHAASLAFILAAIPMRFAEWLGYSGVVGFRVASVLVAALCVTLTGVLALRLTNSRWIAATSVAFMLLANTFLDRAAYGLEPKTTMLVFGLLALLALNRRAWFWVGLSAMAAGLTWRPGFLYLGIVVVVVLLQMKGWQSRAREIVRVGLGACAMLIPYLAFFGLQGALGEMWTTSILLPLALGRGEGLTPLAFSASEFFRGYPDLTIAVLIAAAGLGYFILKVAATPRQLVESFQNELMVAALFLAAIGCVAFNLIDFQGAPDWIPVLPALAIAAAWTGWRAIEAMVHLARSPVWQLRLRWAIGIGLLIVWVILFHQQLPKPMNPKYGWQRQAKAANALVAQMGNQGQVVSVGNAELLYLMHRHNFDDVIGLNGSLPDAVEKLKPGGLQAYVAKLEAAKPELVVVNRIEAQVLATGRLRALGIGSHATFYPLHRVIKEIFMWQRALQNDCFRVGSAWIIVSGAIDGKQTELGLDGVRAKL